MDIQVGYSSRKKKSKLYDEIFFYHRTQTGRPPDEIYVESTRITFFFHFRIELLHKVF